MSPLMERDCPGEVEFVVGHSQAIWGRKETKALQGLSGVHHRLCPVIQWLQWKNCNTLMLAVTSSLLLGQDGPWHILILLFTIGFLELSRK